MKVLSFNVRVWTRDTNKNDLYYWKNRMTCIHDFINEQHPDIICFQELSYPATNYIPKNYKRINLSISHPIYINELNNYKVEKHIFKVHLDYVKLKKNNTYYHIINVHSHWNKKVIKNNCKQINDIISKIQNSNRHKIIVCGDWNNEFDVLTNKEISGDLFEKLKLIKNNVKTFQNFKTGIEYEIDFFAIKNVSSGSVTVFSETAKYHNFEIKMSDHKPLILDTK